MLEGFGGVGGDVEVGVHGSGGEINGDVIGGGGGGRRGVVGGGLGMEEGGEVGERERGEVGAVEGVGVEVEDCFSGGGGGGCEDGFREAGADDDEVEIGGVDGWVGQGVVHCNGDKCWGCLSAYWTVRVLD